MNTAGMVHMDGGAEAVDGRSARWATHREQRRRELIKAARLAIHKLGPDASMDDVAAAAGTSKSVFYRYFGDKAGLQQALGEMVIRRMQEKVLAAGQTAKTPEQGLNSMVSAYLTMAQTSPNVYVFATQSLTGESMFTQDITHATGALGNFFDAIISMVSSPLGEHLGRADTALALYWPTAAIGMVRTAGELWLTSDPSTRPDAETMAQNITRWLFNGISSELTAPEKRGTR
ncbi:AcrR family transcriptional regulator [Arthrobacter russicus]|uniref:AcrR family transcriptional regulator n=2 Tax=Arthrobacter russicus TaxID=172040 RepID=A0ABU1J5V1_9MICC|nr:AcrR family transcriptional regulator [Arthrobacter russicus]